MASANQDQSTTNNHSLAVQRQQQDLVKLLAQHFHHQFYQLANNGIQPPEIATTTAANSRLQSLNTTIQNTRPHYSSEPPVLSGGFNLNHGMNLMTGANNSVLHNHILRSQATNTRHLNSSSVAGGSSATESLIDFSIRNSLNPYPLNDMNLFHALGLNLTNNQLVLSLQQQQQQQQASAAASVRQYESSNEIAGDQEMLRSNSRNSNETNSNINMIDLEDNHTERKEMLKFSINTILGRGSPDSHNTEFKTNLTPKHMMSDVGTQNLLFKQANELFKIKRNLAESNEKDERLSPTECDSNDSCSDSSLIDASTPIPQTSNSILYNQAVPPTNDHHNAHTNNRSSIASNQVPQRNHMQAHQRPAHHNLPFLSGSPAFPWTVAARGKPRRGMMRRAVFSDSQRVGLEKRFQLQKYISKPDRKKLAEKLGLRDSQVKIWFQNRRMKWRNSKERELLSAGGSREQTLPTRNNPNPDLSDVGETIKRIAANNCNQNNDITTTN